MRKKSPPKNEALVVLSGGQDSVTCLFWAQQRFRKVHAITFDYNQRHRLEIDAARKTALLAGCVTHEICELGPILKGYSPLTNPNEKLETYKNAKEMEKVIGDRVELTFVPMRNSLFLTLAANRAVCLGVKNIVTGVCQEDNANYPDCREDFIRSINDAINLALGYDEESCSYLRIHTPLMNCTKAQTVEMAREVGAWHALANSHTAYNGTYPPTSKDHANTLRADGFRKAGLPDPLVLRAWSEGKMKLPKTKNYSTIKPKDVNNLTDLLDKTLKMKPVK